MIETPQEPTPASNGSSGSRFTKWAKAVKLWGYPRQSLRKNRHFRLTLVLVIAIIVFHDIVEIGGYFPRLETSYFVPVSLFFIPILYAAIYFGLGGAVSTTLLVILLTVPNWIFRDTGAEKWGEISQMFVLFIMAIFLGRWVDREKKTRQQREASNTALKAYTTFVLLAQEEERLRIARELHDGPIQNLALLCRELDSVAAPNEILPASVVPKLVQARHITENTIGELRDFARALRPPILEDLGLAAAIRRLLSDFRERTKTTGDFAVNGDEPPLSQDTKITVFRIAQESILNVERHAQATELSVTISFTQNEIRLDIHDNGVGFSVPSSFVNSPTGGQLGMLGMWERAESLGGKLEINSIIGKGTTVAVSVPLFNK